MKSDAELPEAIFGGTPAARARAPVQNRSQLRVTAAIAAAERLLERLGPEATSIPEIAKESGVPRASLYQFFPSKYALFTRIAEMHLARVTRIVAQAGQVDPATPWRALVPGLVNVAGDYYDATPVASMLILGGPFSRPAYLAQEVTIETIGREVRAIMARLDRPLTLPERPDVGTLAVEIAFVCMKHGYYHDGSLTHATRTEAAKAAAAYLALWE